MSDDDVKFMRMAIEESKKSEDETDGRVHPKVGVVIVKDGKVVVTAHRGEISLGDHAEYTALERRSPAVDLARATLYTTLEPCTSRAHKTPCADRVLQRKIRRVVIGAVDPNPEIKGGSIGVFKTSGIEVSFATRELEDEIKALNKEFFEDQIRKASEKEFEAGSKQFERRLREILTLWEGRRGPYAQILIGPLAEKQNYLRQSSQNDSLFTSFTPSFLGIQSSTPRRDRYQFKSYDTRYHFEVYVDGFFYARFPFTTDDNNEVMLATITSLISIFLFYVVRILKIRNVITKQKIHIELGGFRDIEVALSASRLRMSRYFFPADRDEFVFEREFSPSGDWRAIFATACDIYRDIATELGMTDVSANEIHGALKSLVQFDFADLKREYALTSGERVPRVDLKELFGT